MVGIVAFFLMKQHQLPTTIDSPLMKENLMEQVPRAFDQFIYIKSDDNLKKILHASWQHFLSWDFQDLVEEIDEALVWKYTTGTDAYDLLFLKWVQIDMEQLQQSGLINASSGYESRKIDENTWVYGARNTLHWYDDQQWNILDNIFVKTYRDAFHTGKYNLWFVSKPTQIAWFPLLGQFSQKLQYTAVMTRLSDIHTQGTLFLQFVDGVVHDVNTPFVPLFEKNRDDTNLLFAEFHDLVWFFNIPKDEFMMLVPALLGQNGGVYSNLLSTEDYENMYESFHQNLWITVDIDPESILWWDVSLFFQNKNILNVLKKLAPFWKQTLLSFTSTGTVDMHEEEKKIVYRVSLSTWSNDQTMQLLLAEQADGILVRLSHVWEETWIFSWDDQKTPLMYDQNTVISFVFNGDVVQQFGQQWWWFGEWTNALGQSIFVGDIATDAEKGQVIINFEAK